MRHHKNVNRPPPHSPPQPPTADEVIEHFDSLSPFILCQSCLNKGTFTPSAQDKEKFICRADKCAARLTSGAILYHFQQGTFSGSPALGLPIADALREKPKRARSASQREPSTSRKQTTRKAATQSAPIEDSPQELIAQIQSLDPTTSVSEIGPLLIRALQHLLNNNASTPAAVPKPPTSSVAQPTKTPTKPSWSEMLKGHKPEERKKVSEELNKLTYQPPVPHQNKTQEVFKFRQVTIRNIAERLIKEIRNTLFTLRIRLGTIRNICKVGKATYEFLVEADYMKAIMSRMEQYGFPPVADYDYVH